MKASLDSDRLERQPDDEFKSTMLEESEKIDIIVKGDGGSVQLVITDAGLTSDPDERYALLLKKLKAYMGFVLSDSFDDEYPDSTKQDVEILVMCKVAPTDEMLSLDRFVDAENGRQSIPITYEFFGGEDEGSADQVTPRSVPEVPVNTKVPWRTRFRRKMRGRAVWVTVCGLILTAMGLLDPSGAGPNGGGQVALNEIAFGGIAIMGIGLCIFFACNEPKR